MERVATMICIAKSCTKIAGPLSREFPTWRWFQQVCLVVVTIGCLDVDPKGGCFGRRVHIPIG